MSEVVIQATVIQEATRPSEKVIPVNKGAATIFPVTPRTDSNLPATPASALPSTPPSEPEARPFNPTGYLSIDAVDQPAAPRDDWLIDTDVLPRGYTLRLVLQLWISASGNIDQWELDTPPDNEVLARRALAHLKRTPVQPALLNNIAVPSFRRIEVFVSRD